MKRKGKMRDGRGKQEEEKEQNRNRKQERKKRQRKRDRIGGRYGRKRSSASSGSVTERTTMTL